MNPNDNRKYEGAAHSSISKSKPIIVLKEDKNGRNEIFFDMEKGNVMTLEEFISRIETGQYPGYSIKIVKGKPTPFSNPDGRGTNNLG